MRTASVFVCLLVGLVPASTTMAGPMRYRFVPLGLDDGEHYNSEGAGLGLPDVQLNSRGQVTWYAYRTDGGSGTDTWIYDGTAVHAIGLLGSEYVRSDGYRSILPVTMNDAGYIVGTATEFINDSYAGECLWYYDGTQTKTPAPTGPRFTRPDGRRTSYLAGLNESGQINGISETYNSDGLPMLGQAVWLFDGVSTIEVSPQGNEYLHGWSTALPLNDSGQIAGSSERHHNAESRGWGAWFYDGDQTIEIGFTDDHHTADDGTTNGLPVGLNAFGQVAGYSRRYRANEEFGTSAWLYDGTRTIGISPAGPEFVRSDGYRSAITDRMNDAGHVVGLATKFHADDDETTSWFYDGQRTIEIGLAGDHNTSYETNYGSLRLNEAGHVVGSSTRLRNGLPAGRSSWIFAENQTVEIGLSGSSWISSEPLELSEAGQVRGFSRRNSGGDSAWLYDGDETIALGLTGSEYRRNDGYRFSKATDLNELGQVVGYSELFQGSKSLGRDAWLYDSVTDQTYSMRMFTRSDGFAASSISYLGEDGLVLGSYAVESKDGYPAYRAFYFTIEDGLHDLETLIDGDWNAIGWSHLASAIRGNAQGHILGLASVSGDFDDLRHFLLIPIPEPATFALLAPLLAFCTMFRQCRRPLPDKRFAA